MKSIDALKDIYLQMDLWTEQQIPYFFAIDFDQQTSILIRLDELQQVDQNFIWFEFPVVKHSPISGILQLPQIEKQFISFDAYREQFDRVMSHLLRGNTFLTNLTAETYIETETDLESIFKVAKAKYKVYVKDRFVFFSPETFVKIEGDRITTCPMKGTIDASVPDAENKILNDRKEAAEHATIVDLLRNDLSIVSRNVNVKRYRYVDKIEAGEKQLLQVSSEIESLISDEYKNKFGSIFRCLLPAGSISGAPKVKTLEIIREVETHRRGFYTGVCGVFDGETLDSCVMIRFIEQRDGKLYYKSGGGITYRSNAENEYQEMKDKVYVPMD